MRSRLVKSSAFTLAILLVGLSACKRPSTIGSHLAEGGGTAVSWNMAATLDTYGNILVDAKEGDSDLPQWRYTGLELQVANAPDGQIYNGSLTELRYFPLQSGDSDVTFNVLVTTQGGYLCYINGARLDGAGYQVFCKTASAADAAPDDHQRAALADACQRLANTRIDGTSLSDYYARYDSNRNRLACTCLNGRARDVDYASYANRAVLDFEDECKRRLDGTTGPTADVSTLTTTQRAELIHTECSSLAQTRATVQCYAIYATCSTRPLYYETYNGQVARFRSDCLTAIDPAAVNPSDPSASAGLSQLRQQCEAAFGRVTADGNGCICPGERQVLFDTFLTRVQDFAAACL